MCQNKIHRNVCGLAVACMRFGCHLWVALVSQAYPGNAEICLGFPPPQTALCIIQSCEQQIVKKEVIRLGVKGPA